MVHQKDKCKTGIRKSVHILYGKAEKETKQEKYIEGIKIFIKGKLA